MPRANRLPARTPPEVQAAFPALRQSLLAEFDNCPLSARFGLELRGFNTPEQARGILFHRFAGEVLRTLQRTGEQRIPPQEALEVMYEVCEQRGVEPRDVVIVPARERRLLHMLALAFSRYPLRVERLLGGDRGIERRLTTRVEYVDANGELIEREYTGQPDALISDPPGGAVVLDWKTAMSAPPEYHGQHQDGGVPRDVPAGVSYLGYFQQRSYGLLAMDEYRSLERVTLREFYPLAKDHKTGRLGVARVAVVTREDLPRIRRELGMLASWIDQALAGGHDSPLWQPMPGRHCSYCPRPGACPIEREARGDGAITGEEVARRYAAEYVVADRVRAHRREALKTWIMANGPVPVKSAKGRYEVNLDGGRFGVRVPTTSDRGPEDDSLAEAFRSAAERRA